MKVFSSSPELIPMARFKDLFKIMLSNSDIYFASNHGRVSHRELAFDTFNNLKKFPLTKRRWGVIGAPDLQFVRAVLLGIASGSELVLLPEDLSAEDVQYWTVELQLDGVLIGTYKRLDVTVPQIRFTQLEFNPSETTDFIPDFDVKFVAFTSGSTSTRSHKVFGVCGKNTEVFVETFSQIFGLIRGDQWLVCHSLSHIVHLEYVLGCFLKGFECKISSTFDFVLNCMSEKPQVLVTVPSVYELLLQKHQPGLLDSLKVAIIGAANSSLKLKESLIEKGLPVYEGYGMSEAGMLACNTPEQNRLGTVGPLWPGIQGRINLEGVLEVKLQTPRSESYLGIQDGGTFIEDGWICTGDIAELDDGFLKILGRAKNTIVTSSGKNVNPESLEVKLRQIKGLDTAVVVGDSKNYLSALIPVLNRDSELERKTQDEVKLFNRSAPDHERIRELSFFLVPPSIFEQIQTRSGKIRRQLVIEIFEQGLKLSDST